MAKSAKRSTAKKSSQPASKAQPTSKSRPVTKPGIITKPSPDKKAGPTPRQSAAAAPNPLDRIATIDRELLRLIEQRFNVVHELASSTPAGIVVGMHDASVRTGELVAASATAADQVSVAAKQSLLRHVASLCLANVHRMRIAYLGPQYSYTHLAAVKYFGDAAAFAPVASIAAVFEAVSRNEAIAGLVPIENSTDGRIVDTLSMFIRRKMHVCGEVLLPIHHNLLSRTPRERIVEVYSKPQALSQCRAWLANNLPQAKLIDMSSTTAAAQIAAEKPGAAAVASVEAGREYHLDLIDANIEDNPNNFTRFAILGRERLPPTGDDKTAIMFQVDHQPGALADAMVIFKKANLNLTFIESFPIPDRRNEYVFFIELAGHQDNANVAAAIEMLSKRSQRVDVLGSYPRAVV